MSEINAGNVNYGTQTFNGAVYFIQQQPAENAAKPLRIFLSYARADDDKDYDDPAKSFMRRLYNHLTAAGFYVWWDRASLPARGLAFTQEIETAIRECDRMVLIVGDGAIKSDYVRAEWQFAINECKTITAALRNGDYDIIPAELSDKNAIDCRPSRDESAAFDDMVNRLREDALLGMYHGVKPLPHGYIVREKPFQDSRAALCADAINPTVISAPPSAVALYGLGGIGKSTLANALAHDCQVRRHFPDGIIWVEVGRTPIAMSLQATVGTHLGDVRENYQTENDATFSLSRTLQNKAALIVLDDVWDHKLVERFPISGTRCRLLITTRSHQLAGLIKGEDIPLHKLSDEEGERLLTEIIGKPDPLYQAITRAFEGHTLAVSLAAAQIKNGYADSAADMLHLIEKYKDGEEPFKDLIIEETDKDLNLALSLQLSYDALPDNDLRRRFRLTGIFATESMFDRAMMAYIWGDADEDDARRPLQILEGAGLLDAAGDGMYEQHSLLRTYARALMRKDDDELDATFLRYADQVIEKSAQFDELSREEWGQLDNLLSHVDYVGDELVKRYKSIPNDNALTKRVSDFAYNFTRYVNYRPQMIDTPQGRVLHGLDWLEVGLKISIELDDKNRISFMINQLGLIWSALGEQELALDYYNQALPLNRAVGDRLGEATTLNNIGSVWCDLGEYQQALKYYNQALLLNQELGNQEGEAGTLNNIGYVWSALGDLHQALEYYNEALPLNQVVGDRHGEAGTLNNIGYVWSALGDLHQAFHFFNQALPLDKIVGDRGGEATTLTNIGYVWSALGEKEKALEYYNQSLCLFQSVGNRAREAITLNNIGHVWSALGDHRQALEYYNQALILNQALGDQEGVAEILNNIGFIYFQYDALEETIDIQKQIIQVVHGMRAFAWEALYLYNISIVYAGMRCIPEALESIQAGQAILIKYKLPQDAGGIALAQYDALIADLKGESTSQHAFSSPSTLPNETIEMLATNTFAVKTHVPEKLTEWQYHLQEIRADFAQQGEDWAAEVVLVDALLAILDGQIPTLPENNPYADVVKQVIDAIDVYRNDN